MTKQVELPHNQQVCQYGTLHCECRCRGSKHLLKITCPTPERCNPRGKQQKGTQASST